MLLATAGKAINAELIEDRRAEVPPAQVVVPKGGVFFVDLRCWHRGSKSPAPLSSARVPANGTPAAAVPNFSDMPRHMLGVGYGAERDPNAECSHLGMGKQRHVFSAEAREAFNVFDRT